MSYNLKVMGKLLTLLDRFTYEDTINYQSVIKFWFDEIKPKQWWKKDTEFDQLILSRFKEIHSAALIGELYIWRDDPLGRLAEIIVLDQFSRNMYRNNKKAFEGDVIALVLAQEAVKTGIDKVLSLKQKAFLYMPFVHSESLAMHEIAEKLLKQEGLEDNLKSAIRHKKVIERFGRYPHRNKILGRESTIAEIEYLQQPGATF